MRFDDGFLPYAHACLNSLRDRYPGHPPLIVDYAGKDARTLALLDSMRAERLPPEPPPEFARFLHRKRAPEAVFDRFKLWRHQFDRFETILHLDADMLVLHPLDDLFAQTNPYAVANHEPLPQVRVFHPDHARKRALLRRLDEDDLVYPEGPDDMANAGLFTLPRAFRGPQALAQLARFAMRYGQFFAFADQSLLSLWLRARGVLPSSQFADNFQTPFFTDPNIDVPFERIRVLHFSSYRKPGTRSFDQWTRIGPARDKVHTLFNRYRDMDL